MTEAQHVLVVDDNRAIHEDIRKVLTHRPKDAGLASLEAELFGDAQEVAPEPSRFSLQFAAQGQEALLLVERNLAVNVRFAVAFVDMRMPPGWDGLETIDRIWRVDPEIQMVICTAFSDHSWADIAKRLGNRDQLLILKKPFDNVEIIQSAHALSKKWALQQEVNRQMATLNAQVKDRTRELEQANTHLHEKIEQLQRMEAELRLAQKLEGIGQLAAGVAHEINTPAQFVGDNIAFMQTSFADLASLLLAYKGFVEGLPSDKYGSELAALSQRADDIDIDYLLKDIPDAIAQSKDGIEQISRIVRALKQFCHPGQEQRTVVNINDALETTLTVSRNEWKLVAEVERHFDAALPHLSCFAGEINQVFLNLIVNAAHAIESRVHQQPEPKGLLKLETRAVSSGLEVRISDNGCGIPEAVRGRVFEPLFTTKEVGKGTGQGLAIAHAVVSKHAGSIRFETIVGVGTTFIICLPTETSHGATRVDAIADSCPPETSQESMAC
jgi:signal transduction histidine kinase